jgi:SAM-dependent methyltransferase
MGPMLFLPYAAEMASKVARDAASVLEIACGTGLATEALRNALPQLATVTATDLNESMLGMARSKAIPGVKWLQADALELPFPDCSFDAVVCQFGLMFFPDKDQAAREALRVLKPGGEWIFSVWCGIHENPIAEEASSLCCSFYESDPPAFFSVPFGYSDPIEIQRLVCDAGFRDWKLEKVALRGTSPSGEDAAIGLLEGNPIILSILDKGPEKLEPMKKALARTIEERFGKQPTFELKALVCTAQKARAV